jgi:hypothetical protein
MTACRYVVLYLVACVPFSALSAVTPRDSAPEYPKEFTIQLSPDAARAAQRKEQLNLYRKAALGDAEAAKAWQELTAPVRTSLLAEFAVSKDAGPARKRAVRELAKLSPSDDPEGLAVKALARVAVAEADGGLRDLARKGLAARDDARVPAWLLEVVERNEGLVRANAVEALKAIGGPRVYEVIIEHWKETWGAGSRNHVFFGNMRSYIADYDISGDSYAPIIKNYFTGVVLDARSLRLEGDIYYVTIREVTADDVKLPDNPAAWEQWLRKERLGLAKAADEKKKAAAADLAAQKDE